MAILPGDPANYNVQTIITFANAVLDFMTAVAGAAAVIAFIVGAILYFLGAAGGDKESSAAKGKQYVYWAVIGVVVILFARVLVAQVLNVLGPANPVDVNTPTITGNRTPANGN